LNRQPQDQQHNDFQAVNQLNGRYNKERFNAMEDGGTLVKVSKLPEDFSEHALRQHIGEGLGHNITSALAICQILRFPDGSYMSWAYLVFRDEKVAEAVVVVLNATRLEGKRVVAELIHTPKSWQAVTMAACEHNDRCDNERFAAMKAGGTLVKVSKLPKIVSEYALRQHVEGGLGRNYTDALTLCQILQHPGGSNVSSAYLVFREEGVARAAVVELNARPLEGKRVVATVKKATGLYTGVTQGEEEEAAKGNDGGRHGREDSGEPPCKRRHMESG
jgi:hypothetical protein